MRVSVLIITLNEEHYIGKLLDSLLDQTHKDFEVILVDGNSKDKTCEIAEGYKDKLDLQIYRLKSNGIPMQRNYAASKATSEQLMFVDADTMLEPHFLKKVIQSIEKNNPDIIAVWNDPDSNHPLDRFGYWLFNEFMVAVKYIDPVAVGAFTCVKRKSFEEVNGYDEDIGVAEDFELSRRMFKKGYKYLLLKDPKIRFSVRRLVKMGRLNFIKYMLGLSIPYFIWRQGLHKDKFQYDVGNHLKV